ncbi:hypothetical protein [Legionella quateirensis]|uniref:Uncharacterized protein n=2 Tax=Legionella quateirensis TaxID=45072 RepID=A0A378KYP3_9GAMM|nr:hypothetical protein [Legionella quateirensis]KTD44492.1 hypothetical protein Lqua_2896 [Legionella quateirensis]STY16980.1 Uncharacterised protein [Legionella quateirensis]
MTYAASINTMPSFFTESSKLYETEALSAIRTIRALLTCGSNHVSDQNHVDFQRGNAIRAAVPLIALQNALYGIPPSHHVFTRIYLLALKKYGYGHCGELAQAVFIHLIDNGIAPVDMCYTTVGRHALLVLGRTSDSDPTDISTWGDEALICDPWANMIYPVSQFRAKQALNQYNHYNPAIYKEIGEELPPFYLAGDLSIQYGVKNQSEAEEFKNRSQIDPELLYFFQIKINNDSDLNADLMSMKTILIALINSPLAKNKGALPGIKQAWECLTALKIGLETRSEESKPLGSFPVM